MLLLPTEERKLLLLPFKANIKVINSVEPVSKKSLL